MRLIALLLGLLALPAWAQDKPTVAVVNYPLAYFAERLGGDGVEVLFPAPADVDPAFWRPGISDISAIQSADLIVLNGAGYAQWTTKTSLPRSRLVDTTARLSDAFIRTETITHSHGADGEHSHTGTATHTWLDFGMAAAQAETLAAAMSRRIPGGADGIDDRLAALQADLARLGALADAAGASLSDKTIVATHPRYQYFGRAYELEIVSLEWAAGELPNADQWADLESLLAETNASVLLWEAQPPEAALARAAELGLTSVVFPPLANRPADGADFVSSLEGTLEALAAAAE